MRWGNRKIAGQRGADDVDVAGLIQIDGIAGSIALSAPRNVV